MKITKDNFLNLFMSKGEAPKKVKGSAPPFIFIVIGSILLIISAFCLIYGKIDMTKGSTNIIYRKNDPLFFWIYWGIFFCAGSLLVLFGTILGIKNKNNKKIDKVAAAQPTPKSGGRYTRKDILNELAGGFGAFLGWLLAILVTYGIAYIINQITNAN